MAGIDIAAIHALVDRTCAAQDVPVVVTDPATLRTVSAMLDERGADAGGPRRGRRGGHRLASPPDGSEALDGDGTQPEDAWPDHTVVQDRPNDRLLAG